MGHIESKLKVGTWAEKPASLKPGMGLRVCYH